ncbi:acetyltransferase family protein [Lyngbya aestuarii BL J]|uniref:Acetyltransferase family protein n=1 Tax=Lyngbya aestuarii BL J TaxID=1348334 RepID=U7Q8H6_9CYAN|nr:GNAT family N-acetyltransferase [Lyngbya aestuarii]ERT04098.1 acetyltransferase family protein [Lyngbya aestuarii BL J]
MTLFLSQNQNQVNIRPFQYRDLDQIERLCQQALSDTVSDPKTDGVSNSAQDLQKLRRWYGFLKFLSWFPNPCQHLFNILVAEQDDQVRGVIKVSPFNLTRSTWRVNQVAVSPEGDLKSVGSQLLRHCFESIWEARNWLVEVDINDKANIALYRQNGFQRLAQITYWSVEPELLQQLAVAQPDLPNLLPVSNADAQLLYQLDTASMHPFVRQVFDRHISDFKSSVIKAVMDGFKQWFNHTEHISAYVFEPQRKAAIGYFQVQLSRDGRQPHFAELTVNPSYTWLYPELLAQIAHLTQDFPTQSLRVSSADYLPEREAYFEKMGATRIEHSLLMSRSVWHKVRESKLSLEGLQLSDVLQSLQPARKPIPSRISWLGPMNNHPRSKRNSQVSDTLSGQSNAMSEQPESENQNKPIDRPSENQHEG